MQTAGNPKPPPSMGMGMPRTGGMRTPVANRDPADPSKYAKEDYGASGYHPMPTQLPAGVPIISRTGHAQQPEGTFFSQAPGPGGSTSAYDYLSPEMQARAGRFVHWQGPQTGGSSPVYLGPPDAMSIREQEAWLRANDPAGYQRFADARRNAAGLGPGQNLPNDDVGAQPRKSGPAVVRGAKGWFMANAQGKPRDGKYYATAAEARAASNAVMSARPEGWVSTSYGERGARNPASRTLKR